MDKISVLSQTWAQASVMAHSTHTWTNSLAQQEGPITSEQEKDYTRQVRGFKKFVEEIADGISGGNNFNTGGGSS